MRFIRLAIIVCIFQSSLSIAADIASSFEFNDSSGSFTLGTSPNTAVFTNGTAKSIGVLSLYRSGSRSWMIDTGDIGEVTFENPVGEVSFFIRSSSGTSGQLRLYDSNNQLVLTRDSGSSWIEINHIVAEGDAGIARVELEHTGGSGYVVMDDFVCTAADTPPVEENMPLENPLPLSIAKGMATIKLELLASGLTAPNWGVPMPGNEEELFVVDQVGIVWAINLDSGTKRTVLDIGDRLVELGVFGDNSFDERGLLGLAFDPNYLSNGQLYTYSSEPVSGSADFSTLPEGLIANHQSLIIRWQVEEIADPQTIVASDSAQVLIRIDQPQFNHNGGGLAFGADNYLYIALGDGGGADDNDGPDFFDLPIVGHSEGNGQDAGNLLGTLLRIDVTGTNSSNGKYGIPSDNPFVNTNEILDEIYAYGLRNPFRFSFDRNSGELYLADVGQNDIEEIDIITAGGNYGWNSMEGSFSFLPNGDEDGFVVAGPDPAVAEFILPIAEYDHDEGEAIVGGFVNTGENARQLSGHYVFGDYSGRLFYLTNENIVNEITLEGTAGSFGDSVLGFGEDSRGNLYLMANETGIPFGSTGSVYKLVDSTEDDNVQRVYIAYYGRPADLGGLDFWVMQLQEAGGNLSEIIDSFANSPEFDTRFGGLTNSQLIDNIYLQIFGREPDAEGKQFFLDSLEAGTRTLQTITLDILNGAQNEDAVIIANKLAVSRRFTDRLKSSDYVYASDDAAEEAKTLLDSVGIGLEDGFAALEAFFIEN